MNKILSRHFTFSVATLSIVALAVGCGQAERNTKDPLPPVAPTAAKLPAPEAVSTAPATVPVKPIPVPASSTTASSTATPAAGLPTAISSVADDIASSPAGIPAGVEAGPASAMLRPPVNRPRVFIPRTPREAALDSLGRIGRPAVDALIELLHSPDAEVREQACRALSRIGPEAAPAVHELVVTMHDPVESVRKQAIRAIGQIGPPAAEAVPALVEEIKLP